MRSKVARTVLLSRYRDNRTYPAKCGIPTNCHKPSYQALSSQKWRDNIYWLNPYNCLINASSSSHSRYAVSPDSNGFNFEVAFMIASFFISVSAFA